jgi:hypothetical protein
MFDLCVTGMQYSSLGWTGANTIAAYNSGAYNTNLVKNDQMLRRIPLPKDVDPRNFQSYLPAYWTGSVPLPYRNTSMTLSTYPPNLASASTQLAPISSVASCSSSSSITSTISSLAKDESDISSDTNSSDSSMLGKRKLDSAEFLPDSGGAAISGLHLLFAAVNSIEAAQAVE